MVVPKSSPNTRSTITISESALWVLPEFASPNATPGPDFVANKLAELLQENMILYDSSMIFLQNDNNLSSNRGTTYKTGILDPIEFWWVA